MPRRRPLPRYRQRKPKPKINYVWPIVIFSGLIVVVAAGWWLTERQRKVELAAEIERHRNEIREQYGFDPFDEGGGKRLNPLDQTYADKQKLDALNKRATERAVKLAMDYNKELEACGVLKVLDPSCIANDPGMVKGEASLERAKAIIEKYSKQHQEMLQQSFDEMLALDISPASKQVIVETVNATRQTATDELAALWQNERDILAKRQELIRLLKVTEGKWKISGDDITFEQADHDEKFFSLLDEHEKLCSDQQVATGEVGEKLQRQVE